MSNEVLKIADFMINAFFHIWPYLVITISIAVAVNMSGASKYIKRTFDAGPITAIFLATIVGAFSPFCSCGVIPVVAALLIGGVPLSPVMAFWIASPSMDPEIFFLSMGTIGWNLAVWRLVGTLILSLSAGFITHFCVQNQWISMDVLKHKNGIGPGNKLSVIQNFRANAAAKIKNLISFKPAKMVPAAACCTNDANIVTGIAPSVNLSQGMVGQTNFLNAGDESNSCGCDETNSFWSRLSREAWSAPLWLLNL